jgi:putative flippase GtrA
MTQAARRPVTLRYCGVSLAGFVVDAAIVRLLIALGMEPAWARLISLTCAMNATFALNATLVFRQWEGRGLLGKWLRYMLFNSAGNACNYWVFVTLVSTHWPVISKPLFGVAAGSLCAWLINFAATRWIVFRHHASPPSPRSDP